MEKLALVQSTCDYNKETSNMCSEHTGLDKHKPTSVIKIIVKHWIKFLNAPRSLVLVDFC